MGSRNAVVLGGGMAGLLAAAVLAERGDQVTVVERDDLPIDAQPRRGVPQGRHVHVLLPRGSRALEEILPGLLDELIADGGSRSSNLNQLHLDFGGHLLSQADAPSDPIYEQSRPFLESHVLKRVRALPNVTVLDGHDVADLCWDDSGSRVVGAAVVPRTGQHETRRLDADLVVAATGRNARVAAWLTSHGYRPPEEEELRIDLKYVSRLMRLDPALTNGVDAVVVSANPARPTGVALLVQEGGTWVVTLEGFAGHHPPTAEEEWLATVVELAPSAFTEAIRRGEHLSDISAHRFPANLWRRYDKLDRFPDGLLVTGDAVCSFNPVYGQGMTVAALEALVLRDVLRRGRHDLPRRFFKSAAKPVRLAWESATGADLSMPPEVVPGRRPLPVRAINAYVDRYQRAAEGDPVLAWHFLNVTGFDEPTRTLFGPDSVRRMIGQSRRRRRKRALAATSA